MQNHRSFTFTLAELLARYQRKPNYLCFTISDMAGCYFAESPILDADGDKMSEYPKSSDVITKFRELMPEMFDIRRADENFGVNSEIGYYMNKAAFPELLMDPRLYLLEQTIKVYGGDYQLTMDISIDW